MAMAMPLRINIFFVLGALAMVLPCLEAATMQASRVARARHSGQRSEWWGPVKMPFPTATWTAEPMPDQHLHLEVEPDHSFKEWSENQMPVSAHPIEDLEEESDDSVTPQMVDAAFLDGHDQARAAAQLLPGEFSDWLRWSELIYIPKNTFVLCALPKVAGTHLKRLALRIAGAKDWDTPNKTLVHNPTVTKLHLLGLRQGGNPNNVADRRVDELEKVFQDDSIFKAVFVRDPVTRLLSAYLDRCLEKQEWWRCGAESEISFSTLVSNLERLPEMPNTTVDVHFKNQSSFCGLSHLSYSKYNMVGKFETLGASSHAMLRHMGLWHHFGATGWGPHGNEPFPVKERPTGQAKETKSLVCVFYTPELLRRVWRIYQRDFAMFGYSIDHWTKKCGWMPPTDPQNLFLEG